MKTITVANDGARLSKLIAEVAHAGTSVLVTKRVRPMPMAKLVPVYEPERPHLAKIKG